MSGPSQTPGPKSLILSLLLHGVGDSGGLKLMLTKKRPKRVSDDHCICSETLPQGTALTLCPSSEQEHQATQDRTSGHVNNSLVKEDTALGARAMWR